MKWMVLQGARWGMRPFDSNDVGAFQKSVEEDQMVPLEEREARPDQLSEVTHQLCSACNHLAEIVSGCAQELAWRHSTKLTEEELWDVQESLVDVLTVCARFAVVLGRSLEAILVENTEKLRIRYPNGFSAEASLKRVDVEVPNTHLAEDNDECLERR
jgi:hypothetical protein